MLFTEYEVVYVEYPCVWQCIVLAVQELLGVCTVLCMQEGYSMSGGVEGRGDGECVHGCGLMSGRVLWLVVWCAGMYVGGCDFNVRGSL